MGLIHGDHLVEQVAATAFDPTLGNSVLPGTFERSSRQKRAIRGPAPLTASKLYRSATDQYRDTVSLVRKWLQKHPLF